jgi:hypothetical protein
MVTGLWLSCTHPMPGHLLYGYLAPICSHYDVAVIISKIVIRYLFCNKCLRFHFICTLHYILGFGPVVCICLVYGLLGSI